MSPINPPIHTFPGDIPVVGGEYGVLVKYRGQMLMHPDSFFQDDGDGTAMDKAQARASSIKVNWNDYTKRPPLVFVRAMTQGEYEERVNR